MDPKDEKYLILEQYRIYSEAKEKFIDRNFNTNKFYMTAIVVLIFAMIGHGKLGHTRHRCLPNQFRG